MADRLARKGIRLKFNPLDVLGNDWGIDFNSDPTDLNALTSKRCLIRGTPSSFPFEDQGERETFNYKKIPAGTCVRECDLDALVTRVCSNFDCTLEMGRPYRKPEET